MFVLKLCYLYCSPGLITLIILKKGAPGFISNKATAKIRETILRIGQWSLFMLNMYTLVVERKKKKKKKFEPFK